MKKLTKILILALAVALLCGAFVIGASAAGDAPEATEHISFVVYDEEGAVVTTNATEGETEDGDPVTGYVKIADAFANVPSNGTIEVVSNYEDGANTDSVALAGNKQNVTLNLNGFILSTSYCAKNTDTEGYSWQEYSISGSLTITGEGVIEVATAGFIVNSGASLTFDAGEGNTIYLVAKHGYNKDTGALSATKMPGIQFIKVGANSAVNANSTVTVKGNLFFDDQSGKGSTALFGLSGGVTLNIADANIESTIPGLNSAFVENFFSGTYDKETYVGPQVNISNSKITSPYGIFLDGNNAATDYSDAIALTVNNSVLDLVGDDYPAVDGGWKNGDIMAKENKPIKVVMNNTTVYTDNNFFYGKQADEVPNATIQLSGCDINIMNATHKLDGTPLTNFGGEYSYIRFLFLGVVTANTDNTVVYYKSANGVNSRVMRYTHAWGTKAQAEAAGKTDPGYFEELGMGVLFGSGTAFVNERSDALPTSAAACAYSNAYAGYTVESGKSLIADQLVWVNGVAGKGKVVASGEGGKMLTNLSFEDAIVGTNNADNALSSGGYYGANLDTSGFLARNGKYTVCQYAGNNYVTHVAREGNHQYKTDPFMSLGFNAGNSGAYTAAIDTASFYSFEVDMAKAAIYHSRGDFTIGFLFRGPVVGYVNVALTTNNGKSVWKIGGLTGGTSYTAVTLTDAPVAEAGVWQHVQVIIEAPVTNGAFDKNGDFNIYLYLDGVKAGEATLAEANSSIANSIKTATDLKAIAITEVRYKFPAGYWVGDPGSTAFDNILLSRYPVAYDGDLASVVTTKNKLPENLPLVEVNGTTYSDIEAAYSDLVWAMIDEQEGVALKYLMDVTSMMPEFDPTEYGGEGLSYKFVTYGEAPKVKAGIDYLVEAVEGEANTYLVRPAREDEKVTVTWYAADGETVIRTDAGVLPGAALTVPAIENVNVVENDYYKATYDAWTVVGGNKLEGNTFTVPAEDTAIKLTANVVATFSDVNFSIELNDNLGLIYYVPTELVSGEIENVTFAGTNKNAHPSGTNVQIGDKEYSRFIGYTGYNGFAGNNMIDVYYKVTVDGTVYEFTRSFTVSPLAYAQYILSSDAYTAFEKQHVANLVRVANQFILVQSGAYNANVNTVYETYKNLCSSTEENLLDNTNRDMGDLADYVENVYVRVSRNRAQLAVDLKDGSNVTGVKIFFGDATASAGTYAPENTMFGDTAYYQTYATNAVKFYNFFKVMRIELTVEGVAEPVVGQYDVQTWYNNATMSSETEEANWGEFLKAIKELGDTLSLYMYVENPEVQP